MSRRTMAIAAALSVLALRSPLITANANQLADKYIGQGLVQNLLGNHHVAISLFNKAIEIDPQNADAYSNRGAAKHDLEDYQGAIADYTKAIEIDPQNADVYEYRGMARELVNDLDGACRDWRKAVDLGLDRWLFVQRVKKQC